MIKPIITDKSILKLKCQPIDDTIDWSVINSVTQDLLDTAEEHKDNCLGLAANQINEKIRVIVVKIDDEFVPMINPLIIARSKEIKSEPEGCLSRPNEDSIGVRRSKWVLISYVDFKTRELIERKFKDLTTARVIQHEFDHLNGILI